MQPGRRRTHIGDQRQHREPLLSLLKPAPVADLHVADAVLSYLLHVGHLSGTPEFHGVGLKHFEQGVDRGDSAAKQVAAV